MVEGRRGIFEPSPALKAEEPSPRAAAAEVRGSNPLSSETRVISCAPGSHDISVACLAKDRSHSAARRAFTHEQKKAPRRARGLGAGRRGTPRGLGGEKLSAPISRTPRAPLCSRLAWRRAKEFDFHKQNGRPKPPLASCRSGFRPVAFHWSARACSPGQDIVDGGDADWLEAGGRRLPRGFGLKRLVDLPMAWPDQWRALGLQAPAPPLRICLPARG
jgi:hypothetical protein